MAMNSILAAALGGAVGGAVGSLLGTLVGRAFPDKWRSIVRSALSVVFVIIGWQVAVAVLAPSPLSNVTAANIEQELLNNPEMGALARAWRDSDPTSYSRFAERMLASARAGEPQQDIVNAARTELMAAAVPRMSYLNDAQMVEVANISIDHFSRLRTSQPSICLPLFMGQPFGDITPFISPDAQRRELALLEAAFRADTSTPQGSGGGSRASSVDCPRSRHDARECG